MLLLQFAGSAVAVLLMAGIAAWARIPRPTRPLDEALARQILSEEHPDDPIDCLWVDASGDAAIARSGDQAIVLFRVGDGFATRNAPWAELGRIAPKNSELMIRFADPGAPAARFRLAPGQTFAEAGA